MKSEYENNFYPFYKIFSINNNINPTVDILIESIDRFSFGEETDEGNSAKKSDMEEKIKKSAPNNYGLMKTENAVTESNSKLEDINLNDIINNIFDINIINDMNNKNKGKICGLFNKEDFDVKIENKKNHKNNQLNDSFEKRYHNPLKNILDEDDDIPKINNISDIPFPKKKDDHQNKNGPDSNDNKEENKISKDKKDIKEDVKNENELNKENNINMNESNNDKININNNLNNSNSKMKMNNYDTDDDKENEQKIKEIKEINNPDNEIPFIGQLLPYNQNNIEKEKEKEKEKDLQEIKLNNSLNDDNNKDIKDLNLPINKNEIDNNKIINFSQDDDYESPRLGGKYVEEEKNDIKEELINNELKNIDEEIKENNNSVDKNKDDNSKENESLKEKEDNQINNDNNSNNNEQQMNLPLSLSIDNPLVYSKNSSNNNNDSFIDHVNQIINHDKYNNNINNSKDIKIIKDNKENIDNNKKDINKEKNINTNLAELKENSFIIKNTSTKPNTNDDSEEKNKKILELTQKLEKTEKDAQIIKETNEKLLEVINMFKNLQSIEPKKPPNSGKNSRSDTPKRHIIKKRCFTPTLSKTNNMIYNNVQAPYHKRSNSYNKIKINNRSNDNRLYIDYIPVKQRTYRQLHGRDSNKKKEKKNNQTNNSTGKNYGNYINRNTIYLTGNNSSKYLKSPYLNNNMNYTGISYSNGFNNYNKHNNSYSNYLYMNNSSQSFYINNNSINNNLDDNFGNLYQRQVMQMPPNEQPLFYETKSNMNVNNGNNSIYKELVYNKNINYNSENAFNCNNNNIEKNNKYLQEMPFNFNNNSNDLTFKNNMKKNNNNKRNKNKLLDFKDFQIIFDEPLTKEKSDSNRFVKDKQIKNTNNDKSKNKNNNIDNNNNYSNNNYSNNNYNLINYREYSNYKINEINKNNDINNNSMFNENREEKKSIEKYEKENDHNDKEKKDKNYSSNGFLNNFNKNSKKKNNNKVPNDKINKYNMNENFWDEKEENYIRNNESNDFEMIKKNMNGYNGNIMENIINKNNKEYMFPFYLINRNEMFFNILSYTSNEKQKKKFNNNLNNNVNESKKK